MIRKTLCPQAYKVFRITRRAAAASHHPMTTALMQVKTAAATLNTDQDHATQP